MDIEPEHIQAAYRFLSALPPFSEWPLPPPEALQFRVTRHSDRSADYLHDPPTIRVSARRASHVDTLLKLVAHEMCHLMQDAEGKKTRSGWHGADFQARAEEISLHLGFDPKDF